MQAQGHKCRLGKGEEPQWPGRLQKGGGEFLGLSVQ